MMNGEMERNKEEPMFDSFLSLEREIVKTEKPTIKSTSTYRDRAPQIQAYWINERKDSLSWL